MRLRNFFRYDLNIIANLDVDSPRVDNRQVFEFSETKIVADIIIVYQCRNSINLD